MTDTNKNKPSFFQHPPLWVWVIAIIFTIMMTVIAAENILLIAL